MRIIVIGAGVAGLAAARELAASGFEVIVLEARDRLGGRILTDRSFSTPVELGAASIELQQRNPFAQFARQWRVEARAIDYEAVAVYDADGRRFDEVEIDETVDRLEDLIGGAWQTARRESQAAGQRSVQDALTQAGFGDRLDTRLGRLQRWAIGVQGCEYGAELRHLSLGGFDDGFDDDWDDLLVTGGFDHLVARMVDGLDVRLRHEVTAVDYSSRLVRVICASEVFYAERVLVTLPLGVLKAGRVAFNPPLHEAKQAAIGRLGMGNVEKVAVEFAECFWPNDVDFLGFASREPGEFPQFLSLYRATGRPILLATTAGDHARSLSVMSENDAANEAHRALAAMFGPRIPPPINARVTSWQRDPFSLGAYSFVPVSASVGDYEELSRPIGDRLFFAGEATHRHYPATVHGAYLSGLREAERMALA